MHVRRKDYMAYGWAASFSYYQSALDRQNFKRLVLVTDDPQDPFFLRFRSYRPIFFKGNALESFAFMARANKLVISQSSFSWWAAFLSEAESVVMPSSVLAFGPSRMWISRLMMNRGSRSWKPLSPTDLVAWKSSI